MKRKHEESPGRSNEKRTKLTSSESEHGKPSCQLSRSLTMAVLKTNKNNFGSNGLRRSSRRATIERRVWAQPRRERSMKLHRNYDSIAKRGRPRKKKEIPKTQIKNINTKDIVSNNNCVAGKRPKKNGEITECCPIRDNHENLEKKEGGNGRAVVEASFSIDDNDEEGTLIVDDTCLQGAVVDEVIIDYPQEIEPSPLPRNSLTKPNLFYKSYPYSSDCTSTECKPQSSAEQELESIDLKQDSKNINECRDSAVVSEEPQILNLCSKRNESCSYENTKDSPSETHLRIDEGGGDSENNSLVTEPEDRNMLTGREGNEDDNHVSLSEALAKLVDSEESGQGNESETVTIHPFTSAGDDVNNSSFCSHLPMNFTHTVSVSIPKPSAGSFSTKEESSCVIKSSNMQPNIKDEDALSCEEKENANTDSSFSEENSCTEDNLSFEFSHGPLAIPPLIKVSPKPPVIKTPLKCTECPMRFCTVRSLLWHFGTHEPRGKTTGRDSVLLEDLLASWDNPDIPVNTAKLCGNQRIKLKSESFSSGQSLQRDLSASPGGDGKKSQKLMKLSSNENSITASRDFILKVPVPRLKHHKKLSPDRVLSEVEIPSSFSNSSSPLNSSCSSSSSSHFVSILPKLPSGSLTSTTADGADERVSPSNGTLPTSFRKSTSAPFMLKYSPPYQTADAPSSLEPPIQAPPSSSLHTFPSSVSTLNGKTPVISWGDSSTKVTTTVTSTMVNHGKGLVTGAGTGSQAPITVVPVEKLSQLCSQIQNAPLNMAKRNSEGSGPNSSLLEKDGLVMINQNLALRIVSGSQESNDSFKGPPPNLPSGTSCSDSLTILPQRKNESGALKRKVPGAPPPPDILTIVPQSDPSKSSVKGVDPSVSPHLMTAGGKVTPDDSQVVKLILLPPREPRVSPPCEEDSEEESDEGEMVIDVKEEDASMDPLSLCAVTMGGEEESTLRSQSQTPPLTPSGGSSPTIPTIPSQHLRPILPAAIPNATPIKQPLEVTGGEILPHQEIPGMTKKRFPGKQLDEEKYQRRKYVCNFCQKRFGWSTDLKRHVILHTGERPFKCKWCPITFTRKFLLQNHMKKLHSQVCKWSDLWE